MRKNDFCRIARKGFADIDFARIHRKGKGVAVIILEMNTKHCQNDGITETVNGSPELWIGNANRAMGDKDNTTSLIFNGFKGWIIASASFSRYTGVITLIDSWDDK